MTVLYYWIYRLFKSVKPRKIFSLTFFSLSKCARVDRRTRIRGYDDLDRYGLFIELLCKPVRMTFLDRLQWIVVNRSINSENPENRHESISQETNPLMSVDVLLKSRNRPVGLNELSNEMQLRGNYKQTSFVNDNLHLFPWQEFWTDDLLLANICIIPVNETSSCVIMMQRMTGRAYCVCRRFRVVWAECISFTPGVGFSQLRIKDFKCHYIHHRDHKPSGAHYDDRTWKGENYGMCLSYR